MEKWAKIMILFQNCPIISCRYHNDEKGQNAENFMDKIIVPTWKAIC